jgi:hypothetical protein
LEKKWEHERWEENTKSKQTALARSSSSTDPICDICGKRTEFVGSYALTTKQVVATHKYWEFAFSNAFSHIHKMNPSGGDLLKSTIQGMASQSTGWLVCESCSTMFKFDRRIAKDYATRQANPPGSGPVDLELATKYAVVVWSAMYQFGHTPQHPNEGKQYGFIDNTGAPQKKWWKFWK